MTTKKTQSRPVGRSRQDLHPLPMRVSKLAIPRLEALRKADGVSIQEHVRRAIDEYLERTEARYASSPTLAPQPKPAAPAPQAKPAAAPPASPYASVRSL